MAKTKRKKSSKAERRRFYETVVERLLALGATTCRTGEILGNEYLLETALGTLWIWPDKTCIDRGILVGTVFCRFGDVARTCERLNPRKRLGEGLNPYSGKWNFHFTSDTRVDYALDVFFDELQAIMPEATCEQDS